MEKLGSLDPAHPSPGARPVDGVSNAKAAGAERDEEVAAVSSKFFRCACVRRWLPLAYREELYHVLRLTGPLLISRMLNFLLPFVTTIFCGHIGNAELAGYALASATLNVTTTSTGLGLALACDTLISQTYGGKNMKRVGVILQRSSLILLLFCLPCWGILINCYNLLLLMKQEEAVARIAYLYVMIFIPAVPAMFLYHLQVSYLQNQGIILPQMYTAAAANLVNLAANYVLITCLQLGVIGSAIANSLSQIALCLLLFGYIRWRKLHQQTWGGWSTECLQEWGSYMKLAIPSFFMVIFEWWFWEVGGFTAGMLGEESLAAQHILAEIGSITYMVPLGIHGAACVRVGNALGAGNSSGAIVTCKVALILAGGIAVLEGIIIASSKSVLGYIFTTDEGIVQLVSQSLTASTFIQFFDGLLCICSAILIGCGMQKIAAVSNLVAFYFIGLPLGIALMFYAELGILGFWLGLLICIILEDVFFIILIFKLNWKKVTQKAEARAGKKMVAMLKRRSSTLVPDISDSPNTAQLDGEEASKADGYSPVNTQDQELKAGHETEGNNTNAGGTKPNKLLSDTQLILRRGLTLCGSVLVLAAAVVLHIMFPVPELTAQNSTNFTLNFTNDSYTPTPLYLTTNL